MNRRTFLKRFFGGFLTFVGLSGGTYYYAREIEPSMLQLTQEYIYSDKIKPPFNHFKIVQFSDTHIGFHYSLEQLEALVQKINKQKPDVIVFTGDLVDEPRAYSFHHKISEILKKLEARYGKFWIYGNHDHGGYGTDIIFDVLNNANFQLLKNEHAIINVQEEQIAIVGVDDAILGHPNLDLAFQPIKPDLFTILLAHEPDLADDSIAYPVDIQLSGHSHGGQVRFPFLGHLYTPIYAEKYVQGKYIFPNHSLQLYVSKGIGTTRLPFRFLCKPELNVFVLTNDQQNDTF